jgi:hypothetical protein
MNQRWYLLCSALLLSVVSNLAQSQSSSPPLPYQSAHQTLGTVTCASSLCHGSVKRWKDSNVLQNEYVTWSRTDKHAKAYNVLLNARSQKIVKNLGLTQPAHEAKICLDCHTHNIPAAKHGERFKLSDGVTCEACHGPAEQNVADGMFPTDDAAARARMCMGCHFGNKDKLVTHRIMGAGHPRMSFELDTFTETAPKHFVVDKDYNERKRVWSGAKTWAIGQALAVSETMDLMLDDKRGRDGLFPELVLFDCNACHHPMSENRWKPKTAFGPSISPGLVRLNDSNMLMLRALAYGMEPALGERVTQQTRKLHRAIAGDGDAKTEAQALKQLANEIIPIISARPLDATTFRAAALKLSDDGINGFYTDYAAAEQASMAIGSLGGFLSKQGGIRSATSFNQAMKQLNATLQSDERYKPAAFEARLRDVRATLTK